jgi:hypothetical protein
VIHVGKAGGFGGEDPWPTSLIVMIMLLLIGALAGAIGSGIADSRFLDV